MNTVQIKSTHPESQGPFVLVNESDFDPKNHERYIEESADEKPLTAAQIKEQLTARGIEFKPNASKAELQELLGRAQ